MTLWESGAEPRMTKNGARCRKLGFCDEFLSTPSGYLVLIDRGGTTSQRLHADFSDCALVRRTHNPMPSAAMLATATMIASYPAENRAGAEAATTVAL
jgi:hypothetical protein